MFAASTSFPTDSTTRRPGTAPGHAKPGPRARPRLAWVGRFSAEKRLLPFLDAVDRSGIDAEIHIFGDGGQRRAAEARAAGIAQAEVVFRGKVPYRRMLAELRDADALVQTSQGFETQGMTVFEALELGTPSLLSDHRIAADLPAGSHWTTGDDSVEALAATLARAVTELRDGTGPDLGGAGSGHFLQSRQTAAMVEVYRQARSGHATRERSGAAPGPRSCGEPPPGRARGGRPRRPWRTHRWASGIGSNTEGRRSATVSNGSM